MKLFTTMTLALLSPMLKAAPTVDYGAPAKNNQFPNTVKVANIQSHNFFGYQTLSNCTGSLIAPNVVLTAGHCIRRVANTYVYVSFAGDAEAKINTGDKLVGITAKASYVNPTYEKIMAQVNAMNEKINTSEYRHMSDYERENFHKQIHKLLVEAAKNDLAVIELSQNQKISSNHLAKIQCSENLRNGERVMFAGFGVNKVPGTLNANAKDLLHWGSNKVVYKQDSALYVVKNNQEKQLVNSGDSGGPLFKQSNPYVLYAVNALKESDAMGNSTGAYHTALNSAQSKAFFQSLVKSPSISSSIKNSVLHCTR